MIGGVRPEKETAALLALASGSALAVLDSTVMNVAGVTVTHGFGAGFTGLTWLINGYVLSFAALLLLGGALATWYGARRVHLAGLAVFVLASLTAGLSPTFEVLLGARVLQGAGAALFIPSALTLLAHCFPEPGRRARMVGLWTAVISVVTTAGPLAGGLVTDLLGWRAVFLVNVPLGIAAALTVRATIGRVPGRPGALSLPGHTAAAVALALLCFALVEGPARGWTDPWVTGAALAAAAAGLEFVRRERVSRHPVLPATLLGDRGAVAAAVAGFLLNCAVFGRLYVVSVYLQAFAGLSPLWTGMLLLPMTGSLVVGNLLFARVSARLGVARSMVVGFALGGAGSLVPAFGPAGLPLWLFTALLAVSNLGVGLAIPGISVVLLEAGGARHANTASAAVNAVRQVGALIGVALAGAALVALSGVADATAVVFALAAVCLVAAAVVIGRSAGTSSGPVSSKPNHRGIK